ncbi:MULTISPECIES: patatin-like phospholipase family protein [Citrobacter]|uniref:patatin-like phospholipase family protein n=1 Tax=Citrobacter TaxID=544 RepID=UPI00107B9DD6|nr:MULTISPECIES: patatin-like phospholipase family protein [unclassified Citrobacter]MBA7943121.1 patatin-like phospholipase family protein [Citrobacter sp. RHBSTW-00271]MBJ8887510.1 patatin-like phospholipase family protein [Citrobacter sp. FDAARGOS_156]HEF0061002.1 patatin-like phospholipase family protein [Citrobacter pasteurii]
MAMRILSIDGGGIRGILPGMLLVALEKKLQDKEKKPTARIADYFDLVAGTSTGAILCSAYVCPDATGTPKFSAQEAVNFYLQDGDEIFDVGIWKTISSLGGVSDEKYPATELERVLKTAFGDTKLSELLKPTCFVAYDVSSRLPVIFKQHSAVAKKRDFLVRDVLRATSAAPTYFEAARIYSLPPLPQKYVLVDGGVVANDPALCAYSEAIKFSNVAGIKDMIIVSLGTGKKLQGYSYSEVKDWGPFGWAKPAIDIALEGGPQMTAYYLQQIASTVKNAKYYRLQPELYDADPTLDNASRENLERLHNAGLQNAAAFDNTLNEIATLLVSNGGIFNFQG